MDVTRVILLSNYCRTHILVEKLIQNHAKLSLTDRWQLIVEALYSLGNYNRTISLSNQIRDSLLIIISKLVEDKIAPTKLSRELERTRQLACTEIKTLQPSEEISINRTRLVQPLEIKVKIVWESTTSKAIHKMETVDSSPSIYELYQYLTLHHKNEIKPGCTLKDKILKVVLK